MRARRARQAGALLILVGLTAGAVPARGGELTAFASSSYPRDNWRYGAGADLSLSFFRFAVFGGEMARQTSPVFETSMTYVTGHALLALPVKRSFLVYAGVGAGLFYQNEGLLQRSDFGPLGARILGAKVRIEDLVIVKAEYRRYTLRGSPPLDLVHRVALGAGIAF